MSTRSPQNKRSQEMAQGNRTGMARKSASSAKPAREAAGSVRVVPASSKAKRAQLERGEDLSKPSKEERKARKAEINRAEDRVYAVADQIMKENLDYRNYRRVWWMLMILGVVSIVIAWIVMSIGKGDSDFAPLQLSLIVVAYASIIGAFIFDMAKIRPIRNAARAEAQGMSESRKDEVLKRRAEK